jgi:hypothetical protein
MMEQLPLLMMFGMMFCHELIGLFAIQNKKRFD